MIRVPPERSAVARDRAAGPTPDRWAACSTSTIATASNVPRNALVVADDARCRRALHLARRDRPRPAAPALAGEDGKIHGRADVEQAPRGTCSRRAERQVEADEDVRPAKHRSGIAGDTISARMNSRTAGILGGCGFSPPACHDAATFWEGDEWLFARTERFDPWSSRPTPPGLSRSMSARKAFRSVLYAVRRAGDDQRRQRGGASSHSDRLAILGQRDPPSRRAHSISRHHACARHAAAFGRPPLMLCSAGRAVAFPALSGHRAGGDRVRPRGLAAIEWP